MQLQREMEVVRKDRDALRAANLKITSHLFPHSNSSNQGIREPAGLGSGIIMLCFLLGATS